MNDAKDPTGVFRRSYMSDYARRSYLAGWVEGWATRQARETARVLRAVLEGRGFEITDDIHAHITGCTDLEQLLRWLRRAVATKRVKDLGDVFGD